MARGKVTTKITQQLADIKKPLTQLELSGFYISKVVGRERFERSTIALKVLEEKHN